MRIPKLSDKELKKWIGILGVEKIKWLYIESKIQLTSEQLDEIIAAKSEILVAKKGSKNYR